MIGDGTRRFLMEDLRKKFKCSAMGISLIDDIFARYGNGTAPGFPRDPKRGPPFGEIVIPQKMERWAVGLGKLSCFLGPDREMANV